MKNVNLNLPNSQQGYILLLSSVFLFMLIASSAHFFYRATENTRISGMSRDSTKALLFAESAMDHLRGKFVRSRMNSPGGMTQDAVNCAGVNDTDDCHIRQLTGNIDAPENFLTTYMFFISDGVGALKQVSPNLLQLIANGESSNEAATALTTHKITSGGTTLRINDLFVGAISPQLYNLTNPDGRLELSAATSWDTDTASEKAAAWFEVVVNANDSTAVDIIVQSVAQVGNAKSYVQRLVGTLTPGVTLGTLSAMTESSGITRKAMPVPGA